MKDLIAKLQLDATCAMGAIWMHIDAQAARIAELEAENTNLRYELNAALSGGTVSCPSSAALQAPVREVPDDWISISDRLPSDDCRVLAATWFDMTQVQQVEVVSFRAGSGTFSDCNVTHWAPLPVAPVQEPKS